MEFLKELSQFQHPNIRQTEGAGIRFTSTKISNPILDQLIENDQCLSPGSQQSKLSKLRIGIIEERMECNLSQFLKQYESTLTRKQQLSLTKQLLDGAFFMHEIKLFLHGNIHFGNIFINTSAFILKFGDLATMGAFISEKPVTLACQSFHPEFSSPEQIFNYFLNETIIIDQRIDMWGIGIVLYRIWKKKMPSLPWNNQDFLKIPIRAKQWLKNNFEIDTTCKNENEISEIIGLCLKKQYKERATAKTINIRFNQFLNSKE